MRKFLKDQSGVVIAPWMLITAFAVVVGVAMFTPLYDILKAKALEIGDIISGVVSGY